MLANKKHIVPIFTLLMVALCTGCVSMDSHRDRHPEPRERLDQMLELYDQALVDGRECREIWRADNATIDCDRVLEEVERLQIEFPYNKRILMTSAAMSFASGQVQKAQVILDQLLSGPGAHPEAALLRSRVALREGNTTLADELISREILLAPDLADLREMRAAIAYFTGRYEQARNSLATAGRLGTPGWRVSYHMGLLEEAGNDFERACQFYALVLEQKPNHQPSAVRLVGLGNHDACRTYLNSI